RARPAHPGALLFRHLVEKFLAQLMLVLELIRIGHLGHRELMFQALFLHLKGRREREDLFAVLDRHHAARREAGAVATAIDFIKYRNLGIASAQEIAVERMADAALDGLTCGDQ